MRTHIRSQKKDFAVQAYAGTTGAILAMNVTPAKSKGLLGFAIQRRKEGQTDFKFQLSSLHFPGIAHVDKRFNASPSNVAPIQKFRWGIYNIEPGMRWDFKVHPVYGEPENPVLDDPLELSVTTHTTSVGDHSVIFNRAVAASQAFEREFPKVDELLSKQKKLPIEQFPPEAAAWLTRGLLEQVVSFIGDAADENWALDLAIYEYELKAITDAIDAAQGRRVALRVLYHAAPGEEQTKQNEASLAAIDPASKRGRVPLNIFHHKFIVLSRLEGGERKPQAVLCGSTNFTENGVYRQANVVHVVRRKDAAGSYLKLFEQLWANPADGSSTRKWIDQNNRLTGDTKLIIGFSPRSKVPDLGLFAKLIRAAKQDVIFSTTFDLYDTIEDALLGAEGDPILRFGLQNSKSRVTGFHADRGADFVTKALLPKGLEGWQAESTKGQVGNLLIHTKIVVIDFTTKAPTVISGSHNLSRNASYSNDENYFIIRGNRDLADCYGCEVLRFYDHYRFRYYASRNAAQLTALDLAPDDTWTDAYFDPRKLKCLDRERFCPL